MTKMPFFFCFLGFSFSFLYLVVHKKTKNVNINDALCVRARTPFFVRKKIRTNAPAFWFSPIARVLGNNNSPGEF